jgi:hypothetical protein
VIPVPPNKVGSTPRKKDTPVHHHVAASFISFVFVGSVPVLVSSASSLRLWSRLFVLLSLSFVRLVCATALSSGFPLTLGGAFLCLLSCVTSVCPPYLFYCGFAFADLALPRWGLSPAMVGYPVVLPNLLPLFPLFYWLCS